jgi:hypothetical protein
LFQVLKVRGIGGFGTVHLTGLEPAKRLDIEAGSRHADSLPSFFT